MAHPDLELRKGRGGALLAFLPPGISFFAQNKGVGGGGWGSAHLDPPLIVHLKLRNVVTVHSQILCKFWPSLYI